jgi:hypothetical protein
MAPEDRLRAQNVGALPAIVSGGLACGILDITAAFIVYGSFGLMPIPLLQGIAAGALGPRSFEGGLATALLGLFFHFVIAFSAAAVFYAAQQGIFLPASARDRFRHSLWHRGLLLHESHCGAVVGRAALPVFNEDDGHRRCHPHFLRGAADRDRSATLRPQ